MTSQAQAEHSPPPVTAEDEAGRVIEGAFDGMAPKLLAVRTRLTETIGVLTQVFHGLADGLAEQSAQVEHVRLTLRGDKGKRGLLEHVRQTLDQLVASLLTVGESSGRLVKDVEILVADTAAVVSLLDRLSRLSHRTKLIALNSRIEADTKGERGRTFRVVSEEVKLLAEESAQVSSAVRETVLRLRESLDGLDSITGALARQGFEHILSQHNAVLALMVDLDATNTSAGELNARSRQHVATGVRAMQFEDILGQLLQSMGGRVTDLQRLYQGWAEARRTNDPASWDALQALIDEVNADQSHGRVTQRSMDAGTVELF